MNIILYRHLPTKNNLNNTFIGRLDLDCDGQYIDKHRSEIRTKMDSQVLTHLYCSPLKRAQQSANLYFPNLTYAIDRRLIERDLGDWRNIPKQCVREKYPSAFFLSGNLDFNYTPPNGESFDCVLKRVSSFLLDVIDNHDQKDRIGVITHNGIITAVKCLQKHSSSTENIEFQPFLTSYEVEITSKFITFLIECFSTFDMF